MGEKNNSNKKLERITVYISPDLKQEMEEFQKAKGYKSLSDMLRRAYIILRHIFGSDIMELKENNLQEQINRIENKLSDIALELKAIEKKETIIKKEFEQTDIKEIPSFEVVSQAILELIDNFDGIKDFVLMEHLRHKFSEGVIWTTLVKLKNQKIIEEINGVWKRI